MFLDLLEERRSIRKYADKPVEESKIMEIIEAALYAPSARGRNNWEFIVLNEKEDIKTAALCKYNENNFLNDASHIVLILVDSEESATTYPEDAAICATLMQLRATELGVGSCWIQTRESVHPDGYKSREYLREKFNIPENMVVDMMMTFGYPGEEKEPKKPESFEEKVHYGKYRR